MLAAGVGQSSVVQLLLEHGAQVDLCDKVLTAQLCVLAMKN